MQVYFVFTFLLLVCFTRLNSRRVDADVLLRMHQKDSIVGTTCSLSKNEIGECKSFFECDDIIIPGVDPDSRICKWVSEAPIVCCSKNTSFVSFNGREKSEESEENRGPPEPSLLDYSCGYPYGLPIINAYDRNGKHDIYYLNRTAEELKKNGYEVVVEEVVSDALRKFTYRNSTFCDTMYFHKIDGMSPVGGHPAIRERSYYMALLGETDGDATKWYCDGVLINRQWVLTAAHCFTKVGIYINTVRLGEMDWSRTIEEQLENNPENFSIKKLEIHPEFILSSRYHDLALVQLDRPIAQMQHSMNPICLPWGTEAKKSLVGRTVTLTGWGTQSYRATGGSKSTQLQEVDLTVFSTKRCAKSYSKLRGYRTKWPLGMKWNTTLCAGTEGGGKDACKGDSGAPLVYQSEDGKFVLGGIVSAGFGCGLKRYPGIYVPLNNPKYMAWIKEVAFKLL